MRANLFRPDVSLPTDGRAAGSLAHVGPEDLAGGRRWEPIRRRLGAHLAQQSDAVVVHQGAYHLGVLAGRRGVPPPVVDTMRVAARPWFPMRLDELACALHVPLGARGSETAVRMP